MKNNYSSSFDKNWETRKESYYNHWTRGELQNQIQLAFRNHWHTFQEIMETEDFNKGKRCLEVGCGRGSLSAYFSDAGYECTLLDLSPSVIDIAKIIFDNNKLKAKFAVGDVNALPFEDNSFDIVFSIGLLEHLDPIDKSIEEQYRILDKGGLFIGYVVPENKNNIQKDYLWINEILKGYVEQSDKEAAPKADVFRTDSDSKVYMEAMKKAGFKKIQSSGTYPLPMISHSIEFPFTLMPPQSEKAFVEHFSKVLEIRKQETGKNPWLCEEDYGQAFLVWGVK